MAKSPLVSLLACTDVQDQPILSVHPSIHPCIFPVIYSSACHIHSHISPSIPSIHHPPYPLAHPSHLFIIPSIHLPTCPYSLLLIHSFVPFVHLSLHFIPIHPSIHQPITLIHQSNYLSIHPDIHSFIHPSSHSFIK